MGTALALALAITTIQAQIPGRNVNMVSGDTWPEGDPFLQRQNEPSIAASTRNPLHLLAGSNDYRTVDLPGLGDDEIGDAWLGLYKSFDGGRRWTSTLLPGYPQDTSDEGLASPIKGYAAGADPVVRAGTNGLIYYAGLAFDRSLPATPDVPGKSAIFVARFIDNNNKENGDTFQYLGTRALQKDPGGATGNFLDKPWMVVDIPRNNARCTIVTQTDDGPINQSVPAGPLYVAYTLKSTDNQGERYDVYFTMSTNCGNNWTPPVRLNDKKDRANQGATMAIDPRNGDVHTAWRSFDLEGDDDALMTVKFDIKNKKFNALKIARKYLKHKKKKKIDIKKFFKKGGVGKAIEAAVLSPLDQGTSDIKGLLAFRTNAYPSMAIDHTGRIYLVWTERGYAAGSLDPVNGDARVVISTSNNGNNWSDPVPIADETIPTPTGDASARGHQLMPSIAFAGGKLMVVYYDLRETRSKSFNKFIDDVTAFNDPRNLEGLRHTLDIRASMATLSTTPGAPPVFSPSVRVSDYLEGPMTPGGPNVPLQVNPPNLPMFKQGTAPFIGDYVDVTAAPAMIQDATGKWTFNTQTGPTEPIFHATWTDNRDVRAPLVDFTLGGNPLFNGDGNPWNNYAPPNYTGNAPLDLTRPVTQCIPGNAGSRNQNIYTARITGGILVGSPGNTKRLGFRVPEPGQPPELMQRSFVVFAQNTSEQEHIFRLTITSQPTGGRASFTQFDPPLTMIEAVVPRLSTAARTVYVTSSDPHARINITVTEIEELNGVVVTGGLGGVIVLNPDIDNPDIDNPDIDNPGIVNPDIDNAEVYNPDIDNPDIDNPDIDNPDIDNPDIDNPDIDNIRVANPDIDNPDIDNPDIDNPDIDNPDIDNPDIDNPNILSTSLMTDISWSMTNTGNTTAAYNVNLFFAQQNFNPQIKTQLILYRTYKTPVVQNCVLKFETQNVVVANVPDPQLVKASTGEVSDPNDPGPENATIYLAPGESAKITLRIFDPSPDPGSTVVITKPDGITQVTVPRQFVPNEDVTPVVQQQSVDTEDVDDGVTEPPIVVQFPAPQTVPDVASTAPVTPVTINVLANDSTAFGSTKVISLHPANMASHSGGGPGDIAFQSSTGFLYTQRGIVDPVSNALVGRLALPPPNQFGIQYQQANQRTGINYGRVGGPTSGLSALDVRPGSDTFHQYLPMPAVSDTVLSFALDTTHHRMYVVHGTTSGATTTSLSAIDINPANLLTTFHDVLYTTVLPGSQRGQAVAVNSRTRKIYVTTGNTAASGVYVLDGTLAAPPAVKIAGTFGAWSVAINESTDLIFAATALGGQTFGLYVIDGGTNAMTVVSTPYQMRFNPVEERLAIHTASGKVYMRLETQVVIIDGQRGSPTRNTVLATLGVGRESGQTDIVVDQELGQVVTVGNFDFRADIIDVASNAIAETVSLLSGPTDVDIDPATHTAFVSVGVTHVQEIALSPLAYGAAIPVFVESGGIVINPISNKAYAGILGPAGSLGVFSGSGFNGYIPDLKPQSRFLYSTRYNANNRYFVVNQSNAPGTSFGPGTVVSIDGATDTVEATVSTAPNPFGITVNQATGKLYVGTLGGGNIPGGINIFDANDPDNGTGTTATLASGFPLNGPTAFVGFGRHLVVNPNTNKVYVMQIGGSPTSLAVVDPTTNEITPLDGLATALPGGLPAGTTPLLPPGTGAPGAWGRVEVIRVDVSLNRIYLGMFDQATGTTRIVALDGATDTVVASWVGGRHSGRHTASYLIVNEPQDRLYVTDFNTDTVTMLDATGIGNLPIITTTVLADGPSALAFNATSNRLYVSSINSKMLTAIDGATLAVVSTVRMPLLAYFLYVDEIESRIYTSGGDSADESGVMIVTDVLGQLGTNVSVSGKDTTGTAGDVVLNADYSMTYTPPAGFEGPDTFGYTITAPTGTATGTVTVNVVAANPTSVAFGDGYSTPMNMLLTVAAPGPMANDATGGPGATMVIESTGRPTDGVLTEQPDGSFTYQPNPGFTGTDSFRYHTFGALGASNTVEVTISVTGAMDLVVTNILDSGAGSLRQAMLTAKVEPNSTISFDIVGDGPHTIQPTSPLPAMTVPVTIDGYTETGASPNTALIGTNATIKIELRGNGISGTNVHGLLVQGGGTIIRGLAIGGFSGSGILLDLIGGNTVEGNFLGTNAAGMIAVPNGTPPVPPSTFPSGSGVSSQSVNNMIGGTSPGARNLISGNLSTGIRVGNQVTNGVSIHDGTGTSIVNNLVGTNATGNAGLANGNGGISVTVPNVTIGGTSIEYRNVVSGNGGTGINAFPSTTGNPPVLLTIPTNLTVQGNYIGVRANGSGALANTGSGITVAGENATIGGSTGTSPGVACIGACNLISGNTSVGISLSSSTTTNPVPTVFASAAGSLVEGNWIGLNPAGTGAMGNSSTGIQVNAPGVWIGGPNAGQGNVISGNSTGVSFGASTYSGTNVSTTGAGGFVYGNIIGLNAAGTAVVGNNGNGINVGVPNITIGGLNAGERNVIGGSTSSGINAFASTFDPDGNGPQPQVAFTPPVVPSGLKIIGNYIGTRANGSIPAGNNGGGLNLSAPTVEVRGNLISGNLGNGLSLHLHTSTTGQLFASGAGAIVTGNLIGVTADGSGPLGNSSNGISLSVSGVRIGGTTPVERNVISGNGQTGIYSSAGFYDPDGNGPLPTQPMAPPVTPSGLIVQGNYIGTNGAGTLPIPNLNGGISVNGPSVIGGATSGSACTGPCNLVSGNNGQGIALNAHYDGATGNVFSSAAGSTVQGNYVGVNLTGALPLANASNGIGVNVAATIGGSAPGEGNLVAGNGSVGISIWSHSNNANTAAVTTGDGTIVRGNRVGLNAAGTAAIGNGGSGINSSAANVKIGGPSPADGNIIGNAWPNGGIFLGRHPGAGVSVINPGGTNTVQNNRIGFAVNALGQSVRLGGSTGINVQSATNQILDNVVAGGGEAALTRFATGISLFSANASGNFVKGNTVGTNAAGDPGLGYSSSGISIQDASGNTVGGTASLDRNVVAGNSNFGISIDGTSASSSGNVIQGNYIGVKADGATVLANGAGGLNLFANAGATISGTIIGGPAAGERNVIAGNTGSGISLGGAGTTNNTIAGNYIGVAANGTTPRGNSNNGIFINNATDTMIGGPDAADGNRIVSNTGHGIVMNSAAMRNRILGNAIHSNTSLGIDLNWNNVSANDNGDGDSGANGTQNFPVVTNASNTPGPETTVTVDLTSFASGTYVLEFFANATCDGSGHGEGERRIGRAEGVVVPGGSTSFLMSEAVSDDQFITATATDANGNTSEFSACNVQVGVVPTEVTTTSDSGSGSLRSAISFANSVSGTQTLTFNIAGAGPHTIQPATPLPMITAPVIIDGYSQLGSSENTASVGTNASLKIVLDGSAGGGWSGLTVTGGGSTIRGLAITGFSGQGVFFDSAAGGDVLAGNFIGTNAAGLSAVPNGDAVATHAPNTTIGGPNLADRNLLSGNIRSGVRVEASILASTVVNSGQGSRIRNNLIGTNATGMVALPNQQGGIQVAVPMIMIGGTSAADRNVISGNTQSGISTYTQSAGPSPLLLPTNLLVQGNYIGTTADGLGALPNSSNGIYTFGAAAIIGGTTGTTTGACTGACNLIAGNGGNGVGIGNQFNPTTGVITSSGVGTVVEGNYIGVNVTGTAALANSNGIYVTAPNVTIGGATPAARNVISGNNSNAVALFADTYGASNTALPGGTAAGAVIRGNFIGVNAVGGAPLHNAQSAIHSAVPYVTIGGAAAADRNVIASAQFTQSVNFSIQTIGATTVSSGSNSIIQGNHIGVDVGGTIRVSSGSGIWMSTASNEILGNVIAGNGLVGPPMIFATGVTIQGSNATGNVVKGNYIGTNTGGASDLGNTGYGLFIGDASNTTIGGPAASDRNVIVGNLSPGVSIGASNGYTTNGTVIAGNYIGVKPDGVTALPNATGVQLQPNFGGFITNTTIGGTAAGARNVISGNTNNGITLINSAGSGTLIQGNHIGVDKTGATVVPNVDSGIFAYYTPGVTVGGIVTGARNVIAGNRGHAIDLSGTGTTSALVQGNYLGVLADGSTAAGNGTGVWGGSGVIIHNGASGNTIGGASAGAANVIGASVHNGVALQGNATNNLVQGNFIGTNPAGANLGNTNSGVFIWQEDGGDFSNNNTIGGANAGEANVIAFNQTGVAITAAVSNRIQRNAIHSNQFLGIDLGPFGATVNDPNDTDAGANNLQNFPTITSASNTPGPQTVVNVDISSFAAGNYTIEVFASLTCDPSSFGEGERFVGAGTVVQPGGSVTLLEAVPEGQFITATATDSQGNTSEFSACVAVAAPSTVVTTTNDSGAGSLRAAMLAANSTPGAQTITFAIPGASPTSPAIITVSTALPTIDEAVIIDGASQSLYDGLPVIEVRSPTSTMGLVGFYLNANNITIRGLSIHNFGQGILAFQGFSGHQIRQNWIGTNRADATGLGNGNGIHWRASTSLIRDNLVSGNSGDGIYVMLGATDNIFLNNKVGVRTDATMSLPNTGHGIAFFDGPQNNTLDGNIISGNIGWGVDIQKNSTSAPVAGTMLKSNWIGLDANGGDLGNLGGGVRVDTAPGTRVGIPPVAPNIISGNGGNGTGEIGVGVLVIGSVTPRPLIQHNYIGLDPTGVMALPNNNKGIQLDGPAQVGGAGMDEGNWISGNGDAGGGAGIIVGLAGGGSTIVGNTIGLNINNVAVGNGYAGITVRSTGAITIGGPAPPDHNVISGNGSYGISIIKILTGDPAPSNVIVEGNYIGTDASGTLARGNGQAGITVSGTGHRIGGPGNSRNVIVNNGVKGGVTVVATGTQVELHQNLFKNNAGPGIDLNADGVTVNDVNDVDTGPNGLQNYPVILTATNTGASNTQLQVDTSVLAPGLYTLEFFSQASCHASGHGEGETLRATWNNTPGGGGTIPVGFSVALPLGHVVTATATDQATGNTSEFSPCKTITAPPFTAWGAAGTGTVTVVNNGTTGTPQMSYANNGYPNFSGAWQFDSVSASTGTITLGYVWNGFHSYYQVTAGMDVFVNRGGVDISVVTLLAEGPADCGACNPPSGGFTYSGTTAVTVQPGDTYGFRLRGSHYDGTYALQGTLTLNVTP